jgi:hypothetical protein
MNITNDEILDAIKAAWKHSNGSSDYNLGLKDGFFAVVDWLQKQNFCKPPVIGSWTLEN